MYGRQPLFFGTFGVFAAFMAGICGSQNIQTIIILRFLAGAFGSSPLSNAGGVIADLFPARDRGLAMSVFAASPFLGPALGPIAGGFLGETAGWRWVMGLMAAFSGLAWIVVSFIVPETYAPVLLRQRAQKLSKVTGKVYMTKADFEQGAVTIGEAMKTALTRPWILLIKEPIVTIMSIYMAIVYGTLYMLFAAYPIVYQEGRGWSQGIGGLAFLGVLIGMVGAVTYNIFVENPRYQKIVEKGGKGYAEPEARLPPTMIGGVLLPIGLFWFAWTNSPDLPWAASMAAGIPFGFGMVLVFLSIMNYLIGKQSILAMHCADNFRFIHHFRSIMPGSKCRPPKHVRCSLSSLHHSNVPEPRNSLGIQCSSILGGSVHAVSILVLQVWCFHSRQMQVCERV
jgi:MFS family permease